jgi:hypothetical protein
MNPLLSSSMQQASLKAHPERVLDKEFTHISSYLMLSENKNLQTYEPRMKLKKSGCNSATTAAKLLISVWAHLYAVNWHTVAALTA